jgi:hypothetical protein
VLKEIAVIAGDFDDEALGTQVHSFPMAGYGVGGVADEGIRYGRKVGVILEEI